MNDLQRAACEDIRRRYEGDCWRLVKGDLFGASSEEWGRHVAWCFAAGWSPVVCVGYWTRGGIRG